ncbi:Deoxynucleoside_kinase family protein [Hexamita inflata]|uniref:Deoxynucleoside kinase family protein n=1 Tax=Hexamita inflata TaxID=28002 RepID=A0AA86TFX9_9EUKA|nr:Deoxynucleoside kinase family protein [Hexamita inflata]CAI9960019.1 Deoxynucleoside kinase family protein [Hexamita inflata]
MQRATQQNLIILEGGIAAGKTTLLKGLSERYGFFAIEEPVTNNPYLEKFYADPMTYAYPFQMWFLELRIQHYRTAVQHAMNNPSQIVILDRSVFSDYVFALNCYNDGFISKEQFEMYMERYLQALDELPNPAAMLYLNVPPEVCLYRIKNVRCRDCEMGIPIEYLKGLHECYEQLICQMKQMGCQTVNIDWSSFGSVDMIYNQCNEVCLKQEVIV